VTNGHPPPVRVVTDDLTLRFTRDEGRGEIVIESLDVRGGLRTAFVVGRVSFRDWPSVIAGLSIGAEDLDTAALAAHRDRLARLIHGRP